jgi:exodeoxyribonuclease V beta subunit
MSAHHYFLQYHLYAVALHRFLRARQPGYDFSRHFGGVFYLFLRGMSHERGPRTGVFFDRPDEECLTTLSVTLEGARARPKT